MSSNYILNIIRKFKAEIPYAIVLIASFLAFYPSQFTIKDEVSYFNEVLMITGDFDASNDNIRAKYPLGTAMLATPFYLLFGNTGVFLLSFTCLLLSWVILYMCLEKFKVNTIFSYFIFLYPASLTLSRSLMSDMPALLLSSIFLFYWLNKKCKHRELVLGFIAGISALFREPMIILFSPFLLFIFIQGNIKSKLLLSSSVLFGISFRFYSSHYFWNDWLFAKGVNGSELSWSFDQFGFNLMLYSLFLFAFIPLNFRPIFREVKGEFFTFRLAMALYIIFFCFYEYNGRSAGLLKSIILGGRFMLPILPFFIFIIGSYFTDIFISKRKIIFAKYLVAVIFFSLHYLMDVENKKLNQIVRCLKDNTSNDEIIYTNNKRQAWKLINRLNEMNESYVKETMIYSDNCCDIIFDKSGLKSAPMECSFEMLDNSKITVQYSH